MNRRKTIVLASLASVMVAQAGNEQEIVGGNYLNNRQPLLQKDYIELPLGAIRAEGWMQEQLVRMKEGMTGHLDKVYEPVMGARNGWLGGDGDVWERGPYWIDGLLPLAYILNDEALKEKIKPWVEWTLASQKPDGYFGPDTDRTPEPGLQRDNARDWWPKMVMLKVMQQYYSATEDTRVLDFFTKYFKYQLAELPKTPLGHWTFWGEQRGGDNLMMVYWLYNITGDKFLLDLGELIHRQTFNWTDIFLNQDHLSQQHSLHCVNLGQGFKEPVVYYQQNKDPKQIEAVESAVRQIHNTIGLERVAYNALPTQVTDDYSARQYFQQFNQVEVTRKWREFSTPHEDTDVVFGVLTGYPCCTSNLHQGWPKFVQNLWYATADNGIAALVYAPSNVKAKVANGIEVNIQEQTNYPFEETIRFNVSFADKKVKQAFFPFHVRIPAWCEQPVLKVNGKPVQTDACSGQIARVNREWKEGDVLTLELPMKVAVSRWYDNGAVVERGPLLYALKMDEKWVKKTMEPEKVREYGEWYYEVTSDTPWNYALSSRLFDPNKIQENFIVEKSDKIADYPWNVENAPITIKTKAKRLNNWTVVRGSVGPISYFTQQGNDMGDEVETIELIPYGCTTLRVAEFPVRWY